MACTQLAAEDTMRDDPAVIALVARARDGDQGAWNEFVDRYAPLGWSICNRYRLSRHDIDDVGQTVWLLLVEQLGNLAYLQRCPAGWPPPPNGNAFASSGPHAGMTPDRQWTARCPRPTLDDDRAKIIAAELNAALRAAFAELPDCRQLLSMLISDPLAPYAEISAALAIPYRKHRPAACTLPGQAAPLPVPRRLQR